MNRYFFPFDKKASSTSKSSPLDFLSSMMQIECRNILIAPSNIPCPVRSRLCKNTLLLLLMAVCQSFIFAQQEITGIVYGANEVPLENASVVLLGQTTGTVTLSDGSFSLMANEGDTIEISFLGYLTVRRQIENANAPLIISMTAYDFELDEMVVTGYTLQKVKEISGSITTVKPKDLTALPAGQVGQMLQGRVAGLNVINSGQPGAPITIYLHGLGNFGDVRPLYIIDGVPGDINSLNPDDIESLQVLKDAGAYSIYGVRGANGVIVITTKKGRSGEARISYSSYVSYTKPLKNGLDLLSPQENADLIWIAKRNAGQIGPNGNPSDPLYGNGPEPVLPDYIVAGPNNFGLFEGDPRVDPSLYNINPEAGAIYQIVPFNKTGTDWYQELYKPSWSQNHTLTVSGGASNNKYLLSFGYLDQQGTFLNTFLKRYTARVNTEFEILKTIRIGENLQLVHNQNSANSNDFGRAMLTNRFLPVYDIMGNFANLGSFAGIPPGPVAQNPVAFLTLRKDDRYTNWQIFGNAFAEVDLMKQLTFRTSFGGTMNFNYAYNYTFGSYEPPPRGDASRFFEESRNDRSWTWTNTMTYATTFSENHQVKALLGTEQRENYGRGVGGTRTGYFVDDPDYRFLSTGNPDAQSNFSAGSRSYLKSLFSQVNYGFKEKYFLNLVLRRDGSSVFGPERRYGWFPAVSAAWRPTEELFFKGLDWITDLKLRASWGKTGFDGNTDPNNQYTLYGAGPYSSNYDINGTSNSTQQGFRLQNFGNLNTGWQEDLVTNIGLESILWHGRLTVTADYYIKNTKGLLIPISLPAVLGNVNAPNVNIGNIQNKGFDLTIGSRGSFSTDWNWDMLATFASYRNRVKKINDLPFFVDLSPNRLIIRNEVGYPIGSFFGYKVNGIFQDDDDVANSPVQEAAAPGRFKYADVNGRDSEGELTGMPDGIITPDDRVHYGNPNPDFSLGFNMALSYKAFDFSTFFYGTFGNDINNEIKNEIDVFSGSFGVQPKSKAALYESWTPDRPDAIIPIAENNRNFSNSAVANSFRIEKGTYFRCKSMLLGYSIPEKLTQVIKAEKVRIYLQATNLFTFTKYSGLDPESVNQNGEGNLNPSYGVDRGSYPNNQPQYVFGVNLEF